MPILCMSPNFLSSRSQLCLPCIDPSISVPAVLLDPNLDGPGILLLIFGFVYSSASIILMSAPSVARLDNISFSSYV